MTGLRPIDLDGRARTLARKAVRPDLTWLAIDALRIDDSYQRPLGKSGWKNVETIAKDFDWARFTPILAAPIGDGKYAIIDGQHRTHAAALRGFDEVPAMVVPMSHAEQARAFSWVNGQVTAITIYHVFKAALVAREPWALEARDAVENAGCRLMTYPTGAEAKRPRDIYMIGLMREHVDAGRGLLVTRLLKAISASANGDDPFAYSNGILKPLLAVLAQSGSWQDLDLNAFLGKHDPLIIFDDISLRRLSMPLPGRPPVSAMFRREMLARLQAFAGTPQ